MYDITKREVRHSLTAGELVEILREMDPESTITICGSENSIWFHYTKDRKVLTLDAEDLEEYYSYATSNQN